MSNSLITRRSDGGLSGPALTVTALREGKITIKLKDTTKKREKYVTADDSYTAIFKGLDAGVWEVSHSTNSAAIKEVTVGESVVISAFVAWIEVTYPVGSECTCTLYDVDSGDEFEADVIETADGYYKFEVHQQGTWEVYCSTGSGSNKKEIWDNVTVADGKTYTVGLSYTMMLFEENNQCKKTTGGWSSSGYKIPSGYLDCTYSSAVAEEAIAVGMINNGLARTSNIIGTVNKVVLKNYKTLTFDAKVGFVRAQTFGFSKFYIALSTTKTFNPNASTTIMLESITSTSRKTITWDIEDCDEADGYYIIVAALNTGSEGLWYQDNGAIGNPTVAYLNVYSMKIAV